MRAADTSIVVRQNSNLGGFAQGKKLFMLPAVVYTDAALDFSYLSRRSSRDRTDTVAGHGGRDTPVCRRELSPLPATTGDVYPARRNALGDVWTITSVWTIQLASQ